eukprot:5457968-Prymnesium_polylepis.1
MSVPRPVSTSSWYCGHAAAIIKRGASDTAEAVGGQHRTVSNESPMWSIIIAAMHRCWPGQQCISNERITGSLEVMNAHSDTAFAHSSKLSFVQKVCLRQREQLFGTYLIQRLVADNVALPHRGSNAGRWTRPLNFSDIHRVRFLGCEYVMGCGGPVMRERTLVVGRMRAAVRSFGASYTGALISGRTWGL